MTHDKTKLTILSKLSVDGDEESISVDEPYGVIRDTTYTGEYYLVEWPDEEDE